MITLILFSAELQTGNCGRKMRFWLILLLSLTAHILFCEAEEGDSGKNVEAALAPVAEEAAVMSNPVGALHNSRTRRQLWGLGMDEWGMPFQTHPCEGCCCAYTGNCGAPCRCVYTWAMVGTCKLPRN